jgi:hypothetical protein
MNRAKKKSDSPKRQRQAAATQRVQASWDVGQSAFVGCRPAQSLHLHLATRGAGVDDEPVTRFGFREVWVQGREVFLNGTPFRIRPT